jgi:hypothetical protein
MMKPSMLAAVLAALCAAPSLAQSTDRDAEFAAAAAAVVAAVPAPRAVAEPASGPSAKAAKAPSSCADAKELETAFDLTLADVNGRKTERHFTYVDCDEEPRNDYLPPYTQRSYDAPDGYGLTIVTNEGDSSSEVLLSQGKDYVGRFGSLSNEKLVSGEDQWIGEVSIKQGAAETKSYATLRATDGVFPETRACDEGIKKLAGSSPRNSLDKVSTGFNPGPSLVLLAGSQAFYYHEDCDICAELDVCDVKTGASQAVIVAHSVSCSDLLPYRMERGELFSACGPSPR